jgi:hypothetical protein
MSPIKLVWMTGFAKGAVATPVSAVLNAVAPLLLLLLMVAFLRLLLFCSSMMASACPSI